MAMAIIVFMVTAPLLSLLQKHKFTNEYRQDYVLIYNAKISKFMVVLISCIAVLYPIYSVIKNGTDIQSLFSFQELVSYNAEVAKNRYIGESSSGGIISSILLVFLYAAPMIGGTHFGLFKKPKISFITLVPSGLTVVLTNTKAGMIAAVAVFFSGWIIGQIIHYGQPKVNFKTFIFMSVSAIPLVIFLLFSMLLRIGDFSNYMLVNIWNKFMLYAFGDVPAFNSWFADFQPVSYGFGENTFIGIFNLLGISDRVQGLYTDVVYLPVYGLATNVFSAYRALNLDFSWYGSIIFMLIFSVIATICFARLSYGGFLPISSFILMNFYFYVIYSKFTSVWTYSSYTFALILYFIYFLIIKAKNRTEGEA